MKKLEDWYYESSAKLEELGFELEAQFEGSIAIVDGFHDKITFRVYVITPGRLSAELIEMQHETAIELPADIRCEESGISLDGLTSYLGSCLKAN